MKRGTGKYIKSSVAVLCLLGTFIAPSAAQESVCARVKIEIKQELTLERQAFDAEMRITNSLPATPLTDVNVDVKVTDETGAPVTITTDPNDLTAKFFIRLTQKQNISDVSGTGQVAAASTATINWMLIPAPGSAGNTPFGKRYLVGATLRYRFGTETHTMELNPDAITVKPMPSLTLDYFLTRDIIADDPFTTEIEVPEPYTLGVRVKNSGLAAANKLKIDSAQPRIVENNQGLPINFVILGSYVQDMPATNSLLIDFGDIGPTSSKMGRWQMESNLAGTFVDFNATFTHSDELGGALTSLLQATNAHLLVRDVRVDLPGRDVIRDFLAEEGGLYKVYESEGVDSTVTNRSAEAQLTVAGGAYQLVMPATPGFFYVRKPDPHRGSMALSSIMRADAKQMAPENVWLSKTKNRDTQQWEYWFNVFDANSPGGYQVAFKPLDQDPKPPVLQFIPDRVVKENEQVSFLVEASSPMGKAVTLSASPLPTGATFQDQSGGTAVFDWTPEVGQAGSYIVNYLASDGSLTGSRSAKIRVEPIEPPPGPAIPQIVAPLHGAEITSLRPQFQVLTGEASNDPTVSVQFELYADAGFTEKLFEATVAENPTAEQPTTWTPEQDLNDNTRYYWRVRGVSADGINSAWANGAFFANLFNDAPESFNLTSPVAGGDVDSLTAMLSATNAVDRDGDVVTYGFDVYKDSALTQRHAWTSGLPAGTNGMTQWEVPFLTDHATYYWRGTATDEHGAQTITPVRSFRVFINNQAPVTPTIISPAPGTNGVGVALLRVSSTDPDGDALRYFFEIDVVNTFDSSLRQSSGEVPASGNGTAAWQADNLTENRHYYWRAKASDGHAESQWVVGDFGLDTSNEPPATPVVANPGDRAWVATLSPMFEVHPSTDPEGDTVHYRFEVYRDAALTNLVTSGTSNTLTWQPTLTDRTTYHWRVCAEDISGNASAWAPTSVLFVSTGDYYPPMLQMREPGRIWDARDGNPTITWVSSSYSIDSTTMALYYDQAGSGFAGTKIVDGLPQRMDSIDYPRSYVWNLSGLSPGAYYIYGINYDDKDFDRQYASGQVVVPSNPQLGTVHASVSANLDLREGLDTGQISVVLGRAPTKDVVISITSNDSSEAYVLAGGYFSGFAGPAELKFTPSNWSTPQSVDVIAVKDGTMDGDQNFAVTVGKPVSLDPDYNGLPAHSLSAVVRDQDTSSGTGLSVSDYIPTGKRQAGSQWEHSYLVVLSNNSAGPVSYVIAKALSAEGFTFRADTVHFGSIGQSEAAVSMTELILNSASDVTVQRPDVVWEFQAW